MSRSQVRTALAIACALASWVALAQDKSGTRPNVISVPHGPGSVEGLGESFEVNLNSGSVTESIGLRAPPGTGGMTPQLALSYDSGNGNGPVGLGWALGVASLQVQTEKGLPRYDGTDRYLYQGSELVPLADGSYRLKNEGAFVRARRSGDGWEVDLPSGATRRFGLDPEARVEDSGRVFAWYLEDEVDVFGNRVSYFYAKDGGQPYLTSVQYNRRTGAADNRLDFEYEARPDALADYRATFKVVTAQRLKHVRVYAQGALVRHYALAYEPSAPLSLLANVTLYGSDDATALPSVQLGYTGFNPDQSPQHTVAQAPATLPGSSPDAELADIDGDGFPDLLVASNAGHTWYRNVGGQSYEAGRAMPQSPSLTLGTTGVDLADLNGDGLVDLVARTDTTSQGFRYFPGTGQGQWGAAQVFGNNPGFGVADGQTRWADLDHDKLPDAFQLTATSAIWWRSNGDGTWSTGESLPLPPGGTALDFSDVRVKLADVNGDRMLDLVFVRSGSVLYWPGMGRGLFDAPVSIANAPDIGSGLESRLQLADLNGDGMADLFYADTDHVDYWLQLPTGAFDVKRTIAGTPYADASLTQVRTGDMNGNGSVDIIWFTPTAAPDARVTYLDPQQGVRPNLLQRVSNGLGKVRTLRYGTSADEYQASAAAGTPWAMRLPFPVQVISESTLSDSRGGTYVTDYHYVDGYYDAGNREFRGFRRVEQRDLGEDADPTVRVVHEYELGIAWEALKGREVLRETRADDGRLFEQVQNTWQPRVYASGTDGRDCVGAELQQADTFVYEGSDTPAQLREAWTYDDFGNALTDFKYGQVINGDPLAGGDEAFVTRTYANDAVAWLLGRVVEESVSDASGTVLSRTRHYYDGPDFVGLPLGQLGSHGTVTRTEGWVDGDRFISTDRVQRDDFGNVVATMSPRGLVRQLQFDPTHTFVDQEKLPSDGGDLVWKSAHDPGTGSTLWVTDPNGQTTAARYDALGRLVALIQPGDSDLLPSASYEYRLGSPLSFLTTHTRLQSGQRATSESVTVSDGLSRTVATARKLGDGYLVGKGVRFDARGQPGEQFQPFFAPAPDAQPPAGTLSDHFLYDATSRAIAHVAADGSSSRTSYFPLGRNEFDADDAAGLRPRTVLQDGLGNVVQVLERLRGADGTVRTLSSTFATDARGHLRRVVDAAGHGRTLDFDGLGRQVSASSPDTGQRLTTYDDDGNPVQVSSEQGTVTTDYDLLGRVLTVTGHRPDGTVESAIRYHYDAPPPDGAPGPYLGRLAWVEDDGGSEAMTYDGRGRVLSTTRTLEGKRFTLGFTYDAVDRLVQLTYPDGSRLGQEFDEAGRLIRIPGLLEQAEYTPSDKVSVLHLSNGVRESVDYDAQLRLQHHLVALDKKALRDATYHYDGRSNLLAVEDAASPVLSASYQFDDLSRLVQATVGGRPFAYAYADDGNLTGLNGASASYDPARPHALTQLGSQSLVYGAGGALIAWEGKQATYDSKRQLRQVTLPDGSTITYTYDYTGRLLEQKGANGTILYPSRYVEVDPSGTSYFVYAGNRRLARFDGGASAAAGAALLPVGLLGWLLSRLAGRRGARKAGSRRAGGALLLMTFVPLLVQCGACQALNGVRYFHRDLLGSVIFTSDASGKASAPISYDPFGQPVGDTRERELFAGREFDRKANLALLGARALAVSVTRWTQPDLDSLVEVGRHVMQPQGLNPYSYAVNNPVSYTDQTGLFEEPVHGALTYHLAMLAGFSPQDAKQLALACAGVDHDPQTEPVSLQNTWQGKTTHWHFDANAGQRVQDKLDRGVPNLTTFGRDLHTLEDVGFEGSLGPHFNGVPHYGPTNSGSQRWGHPYRDKGHHNPNEDGTEGNWKQHTADQPYHNPRANTAELKRVFAVLMEASARRNGTKVSDEARGQADRLITSVVNMRTGDEIKALLNRQPAPGVPSYVQIVNDNNSDPGAAVRWSAEKIDNSIK